MSGDERRVTSGRGVREEERGEGWRVGFWNVAGLSNKDKEFWNGLLEWDIIVLIETWAEEKGWERIRRYLPKGYVWKTQWAKRRNRKGRAMGGMAMGIRKEMLEKRGETEPEEEELMVGAVKVGEERWKIIGVYVNGNMEEMLKKMEKWMDGRGDGCKVLIGGDFNARTGREGGRIKEGEEYRSGDRKSRKSKDGKMNKEGKKLIEVIEEKGWSIFNGNISGDEEGEYTFTGGKGCTVIDYVMGDEEVRGKVRSMKIGERIDSDHQPVEVWIKGEAEKRRRNGGKQGAGRVIWDGETREVFREKLKMVKTEGKSVEEEWGEKEEKIRGVLKEMEKQREGKKRERGWWDKECKEKKREVRMELREWRRSNKGGEVYKEKKQKYKMLCEEKKREETERWEKEAEQVRREGEVWEIVNRGRKKRKGINEEIEEEEWKEHFMRLLGGVENRVVEGEGEGESTKKRK